MNTHTIRAALAALAIAFASSAWASVVINVPPEGDLAAAVAAAADDTVFQLSAGDYEFSAQISITGKSNLRFVGAGSDATAFVRKGDAATRFFRLADSTNIGFEGVSFKGGRVEAISGTGESFQGGAVWSSAVSGLAFKNCAFLGNELVNDSVSASASVTTLKGGALYAVDSTLVCVDCRFERNSAYDSKTSNSQYPPCGGAIYLNNATGASGSSVRITAAFTNVVFLANHGGSKSTYATSVSLDGSAICGVSAGIDVYNGLFTGQYSSGAFCLRDVNVNTGTGAFSRYTQCSIVDNVAHAAHRGGGQYPVFIRSVCSGLHDIYLYVGNWEKNYSVMIDSVFMTRRGEYTAPVASATICGTQFISTNWIHADPGIVKEGEAKGAEAVARDAGWRPTDGRTYRTLHVATTGSDATGTGSAKAPFRSLTKALSGVKSGETIQLAAGTYSPTSGEVFPMDLEDKHHVTIKGSGRAVTILTGEGADSDTFLLANRASGLRVLDLTVTGGNVNTKKADDRPALVRLDNSGTVRFDNLSITGNIARADACYIGYGMLRAMRSALEIRDCDLSDNSYRMAQNWGHCSSVNGLIVNSTIGDLLIDRCRFDRVVGDANGGSSHGKISYGTYPSGDGYYCLSVYFAGGVNCQMDFRNCLLNKVGELVRPLSGSSWAPGGCAAMEITGDCRFENNTVNCNAGLPFVRTTGMVFRNVIFVGTNTILRGTYQSWESKPSVYNAIFESTDEDDPSLANFSNWATETSLTVHAGTTTSFTDAENGDYTLTAESAEAIDQGAVCTWMSLAESQKDLLGNPRCVGYLMKKNKIPDLGCYELPRKLKGLQVLVR